MYQIRSSPYRIHPSAIVFQGPTQVPLLSSHHFIYSEVRDLIRINGASSLTKEETLIRYKGNTKGRNGGGKEREGGGRKNKRAEAHASLRLAGSPVRLDSCRVFLSQVWLLTNGLALLLLRHGLASPVRFPVP